MVLLCRRTSYDSSGRSERTRSPKGGLRDVRLPMLPLPPGLVAWFVMDAIWKTEDATFVDESFSTQSLSASQLLNQAVGPKFSRHETKRSRLEPKQGTTASRIPSNFQLIHSKETTLTYHPYLGNGNDECHRFVRNEILVSSNEGKFEAKYDFVVTKQACLTMSYRWHSLRNKASERFLCNVGRNQWHRNV